MNQYFAYIRVSTAKQGEQGSSLQQQRAAIESYAARFGLSISTWFEEQETAAKRGRDVFTKMLALLVRGKARGVIIHKIDRGARNLRDWADLGDLMDQGVEVHFAHESLDLTSRGGRLSADIQAVVAADYIRNLRDEVRKGFYGRLKQGLYPLPAPFGYRDNGKGKPKTIDPVTGPMARLVFELYGTGRYTLDTLCPELRARGVRTKRGCEIKRNRLSVILNDSFYVGLIRIRRTNETFQGVHEPLIATSLFERVQDILNGRAKGRGIKHDYLYRKTFRCERCGYTLIPECQKGHVYYRCHTKTCVGVSFREDRIDAVFRGALKSLTLRDDELHLLQEEYRTYLTASHDNRNKESEAVRLRIASVDARLGRLTDAYVDRLLEKGLFEERKAALLKERVALKEALADIEAGVGGTAARLAKFLELLQSLKTRAPLANVTERRDLVKAATSNLAASGKTIVFTWRPLLRVVLSRDNPHHGAQERT